MRVGRIPYLNSEPFYFGLDGHAPDAVVAGDEADREEGDGTGAPRPGPRRRGRERAGVGGRP